MANATTTPAMPAHRRRDHAPDPGAELGELPATARPPARATAPPGGPGTGTAGCGPPPPRHGEDPHLGRLIGPGQQLQQHGRGVDEGLGQHGGGEQPPRPLGQFGPRHLGFVRVCVRRHHSAGTATSRGAMPRARPMGPAVRIPAPSSLRQIASRRAPRRPGSPRSGRSAPIPTARPRSSWPPGTRPTEHEAHHQQPLAVEQSIGEVGSGQRRTRPRARPQHRAQRQRPTHDRAPAEAGHPTTHEAAAHLLLEGQEDPAHHEHQGPQHREAARLGRPQHPGRDDQVSVGGHPGDGQPGTDGHRPGGEGVLGSRAPSGMAMSHLPPGSRGPGGDGEPPQGRRPQHYAARGPSSGASTPGRLPSRRTGP